MRERRASLDNWWDVAALEAHLQTAAPPIKSWDALRDVAIRRFGHLPFAGDCFRPIAGLPFSVGAAERVLLLFDILARLVRAFDSSGRRTAEGHDNLTEPTSRAATRCSPTLRTRRSWIFVMN